MEDTNALIEQRKAKLAALRAKGIDPFRNKFTPAESCAEARARYAEGRAVTLAGRITAHRDMGKSMFIDVQATRAGAFSVMLRRTPWARSRSTFSSIWTWAISSESRAPCSRPRRAKSV